MTEKLKSRKFIVWVTATIFMLAFIVLTFVLKGSNTVESFLPWWGIISIGYIGGNVAQDFTRRKE